MNAIVSITPGTPGLPVTPESFERLSRHLKAEDKAQLVWFPKRLQETILEPLWSCESNSELDEIEMDLGSEFATMSTGLFSRLFRLVSRDPDVMAGIVEKEGRLTLEKARRRISEHLGGAVWDSLEWAWYTQVEMMRVFLPVIGKIDAEKLETARSEIEEDQPEDLKAVRSMNLYTLAGLAATEREKVPLPVLTAEFCHRAYVGACSVIDALRRLRIHIDPYRHEPPEKRRERIARTAGQVLSGLSDEDLAQVDSSSLENSTFFPAQSELP
ncbi:MAG: hypothetical protein R6V85_11775 [Polyangia bacterium]